MSFHPDRGNVGIAVQRLKELGATGIEVEWRRRHHLIRYVTKEGVAHYASVRHSRIDPRKLRVFIAQSVNSAAGRQQLATEQKERRKLNER